MPAIGLSGSVCADGFTISFAPMIMDTSTSGKVVVDLVHLEHDVVGHLGFGQQYVHVPGHATRYRVYPEAHVDALVTQRVA